MHILFCKSLIFYIFFVESCYYLIKYFNPNIKRINIYKSVAIIYIPLASLGIILDYLTTIKF